MGIDKRIIQFRRSTLSNHGITFIEILLILMFLAIFTAIFVRIYQSVAVTHKYDKEQQDILTIENGMVFYKIDNGFYPTSQQGILALVIKPATKPIPQHWTKYLSAIPLDKRGKPYHYANPGKLNDIDIYSDDPDTWWGKIKLFLGLYSKENP